MTYQPSNEILEKYANVLVNFALNDGNGINKGDAVNIQVPECAKPILEPLRNAVLKAGGHPIIQYLPDGVSRGLFENASDEQLSFFADKLLKGKIDQLDHNISIIAEVDKQELKGIDPKKIMLKQSAAKPFIEWIDEKENAGKFTWTLGLYGTEAMAKEVNMSLEEYWNEIIKACYLDHPDPVATWKETFKEIERVKTKLNELEIKEVHLESENTDIKIGLGKNRIWKGGSGRNIPSFEVFTSPDWREVNGHIQFTEPLYCYGNIIENVYLEIRDGLIVKATATKGEEVLKEMIEAENANKIGEFSLTDGRLSKITKFMAETLYDENVGGPQGNTHLAVGQAYKDCCKIDPANVSKKQWKEWGFNESVVHTDIVATSKRKVTATLTDGKEILIYEDGKFTI